MKRLILILFFGVSLIYTAQAACTPSGLEIVGNYIDEDCDGWINGTEFTVRGEHPRLILTPTKMAEIRSKVNTNDLDWQAMYRSRNDYLSGNPPYGSSSFLVKWALLYLITNDSSYLNRVRAVLWNYSALDTFDYTNRNGFRGGAENFIMVYDWLYNDWTIAERENYKQHIITWVNYWTNYVDYNNNFSAYRWSDSDETKSLMLNFLCMGTALFGEDATAESSLRISDRMWDKTEEVFWNNMAGIPLEGAYYGSETRRYAIRYLIHLKSSRGIDLTDDVGTNYALMLDESVDYLVHSTSPDFNWLYSFGDIQEPASYGLENFQRERIYHSLELLELIKNKKKDAEYLRQWIDDSYTLPFSSLSTDVYVNEMLFNDRLANRDAYSNLPNYRYFERDNFVLSRSNWDYSNENIWWGFQFKKPFVDHMTSDLLSYQIMRGNDYLTKEVSGYSGASAQGIAHNTVLVENQDSLYSGAGGDYTDGNAELESLELTDDYSYLNVNASAAYSGFVNPYWDSTAEIVARKFVNIRPGYFVVFDIVKTRAESGDAKKAISNHFINQPIITNGLISSTEGDSKIFVKYLLPQISDLNITLVNESSYYMGASESAVPLNQRRWHTLTESKTNLFSVNFMSVTEVGPSALMVMSPTELVNSEDGKMQGAFINNSWAVMFAKNNELINQTQYTLNSTGSVKNLVVDLRPSTVYYIYDNGALMRTATSSSQGTLFFNVSTGSHTVRISETTTSYHAADSNMNNYIEISEIMGYVRQFKLGTVTRTDVLIGVRNWLLGRYQ